MRMAQLSMDVRRSHKEQTSTLVRHVGVRRAREGGIV